MRQRTYFDTSVLRYLLNDHPRTASVRERLEDLEAVSASSQIAITELHRTALVLPSVSAAEVDAVLDKVSLVAITEDQLRRAGLLPALSAGVQLRSLDALHVQAALDLGATEFLTSDKRQAKAARAAGLKVTLL